MITELCLQWYAERTCNHYEVLHHILEQLFLPYPWSIQFKKKKKYGNYCFLPIHTSSLEHTFSSSLHSISLASSSSRATCQSWVSLWMSRVSCWLVDVAWSSCSRNMVLTCSRPLHLINGKQIFEEQCKEMLISHRMIKLICTMTISTNMITLNWAVTGIGTTKRLNQTG